MDDGFIALRNDKATGTSKFVLKTLNQKLNFATGRDHRNNT